MLCLRFASVCRALGISTEFPHTEAYAPFSDTALTPWADFQADRAAEIGAPFFFVAWRSNRTPYPRADTQFPFRSCNACRSSGNSSGGNGGNGSGSRPDGGLRIGSIRHRQRTHPTSSSRMRHGAADPDKTALVCPAGPESLSSRSPPIKLCTNVGNHSVTTANGSTSQCCDGKRFSTTPIVLRTSPPPVVFTSRTDSRLISMRGVCAGSKDGTRDNGFTCNDVPITSSRSRSPPSPNIRF